MKKKYAINVQIKNVDFGYQQNFSIEVRNKKIKGNFYDGKSYKLHLGLKFKCSNILELDRNVSWFLVAIPKDPIDDAVPFGILDLKLKF